MRLKKVWSIGAGLALLGSLTIGSALAADPADESPIGGTHAHRHFVITPNGCVDIDQVYFEPDVRGLRRAAFASGPDQGPWHAIPGLGCEDLGY